MKRTILYFTLALCMPVLFGCGKKADEKKPLPEVKAEAEKMSVNELKSIATKYQDVLVAKKAEVEKITAKLKNVPVTEMLGAEAKTLKADIDNLNNSISALKERFDIYYNKLKEKGGELPNLKI